MKSQTIRSSKVLGVSLPEKLYLKRDGEWDTIWRFGSRRLKVVWTVIKEKPILFDPYKAPTSHLIAVGRLHIGYGPGDGISEGLGGVKGMHYHMFWARRPFHRSLGIGWEAA